MHFIFILIIAIIFFCIHHFRKEKLNADYEEEKDYARDHIILEISNLKSKQNRVYIFGECKVDIFLTNDRLYINTHSRPRHYNSLPHPLILTREELEKRRKCQLLRIGTNLHGCSLFFTFMGTSTSRPDQIRIYDLTPEQKQLIADVLKISEGKDGLHVYYLEKLSE